jgi:polyphosphate kinase
MRDNIGYLAIKLVMKKEIQVRYAIIEIQNDESIVFYLYLNKQYVILIDDVIRHNLKVFLIFSSKKACRHI